MEKKWRVRSTKRKNKQCRDCDIHDNNARWNAFIGTVLRITFCSRIVLGILSQKKIRDRFYLQRRSYLLRSPLQLLRDGGAQIGAGDRRRPGDILARRRVRGRRGVRHFASDASGPGTGRHRTVRDGGRRLAGRRRQGRWCRRRILAARRLEARLGLRRAGTAHRHGAAHLHAHGVHWFGLCNGKKHTRWLVMVTWNVRSEWAS